MLFCIKWLSGMQEFSVLFNVRFAVWYAGISCFLVSKGLSGVHDYRVVYNLKDRLVC